MRRLLSLAALMTLAACGSSTSTAATPSPTVSGAPAASPSPVALSCKIPIAAGDAALDGNPADGATGHGGFLSYPAATFSNDPASLGTWDAAKHKWLPVGRYAVSPDGSQYAVSPPTPSGGGPVAGTINVIDAATGSIAKSLPVPGPSGVIGWTSDGIYVSHIVPNSDAPPMGISLLNPNTGDFHQITAVAKNWVLPAAGFAYGTDVNPADPSPPVQNGPGPAPGDEVVRINLGTGTIDTVSYTPGKTMSMLGLDPQGHPVVAAWDAAGYAVLDAGQTVYQGPSPTFTNTDPSPNGPLAADSNGVWFSSGIGAIYLLKPGASTLTKVATLAVGSPQVAGPCA